MKTAFILMAQYDGRAIVPVDLVCRDYFAHLTPREFIRKTTAGQIDIPVVSIEASQKAARGVHVADLAACSRFRRTPSALHSRVPASS